MNTDRIGKIKKKHDVFYKLFLVNFLAVPDTLYTLQIPTHLSYEGSG